jgi:hypothetical protein
MISPNAIEGFDLPISYLQLFLCSFSFSYPFVLIFVFSIDYLYLNDDGEVSTILRRGRLLVVLVSSH